MMTQMCDNEKISLRMLVCDWYDGPVGGVVERHSKSYCFFLLDWDSEHRIRLYGLQPIRGDIDPLVVQLTSETPKWPVWFPSDLIHPTERSREWTRSVKALRYSPDCVESVLTWDAKNELMLGIQLLQPEDGRNTLPWFDAVESLGEPFDWFALLSLPRK